MPAAEDKNLKLIESKLKFVARAVSNIQTEDFEAQRDVHMAVESALRALFEYKLSLKPGVTEEMTKAA